jgi:hypothetical protein
MVTHDFDEKETVGIYLGQQFEKTPQRCYLHQQNQGIWFCQWSFIGHKPQELSETHVSPHV